MTEVESAKAGVCFSTLNASWDWWQSNYFLFLTAVFCAFLKENTHTHNFEKKASGRVCYKSI